MIYNQAGRIELVSGFLYLILLPLFFILHGTNENFGLIPFHVLGKLFILYSLITVGIFGLSILFLRDLSKASLFSFYLLALYFFFGAFHDLVKKVFQSGFITSYTFILAFLLIISVPVFFSIRTKKVKGTRALQYCRWLLVFFLVWETAGLGINFFNKKQSGNGLSSSTPALLKAPDHCTDTTRPDIFFVVLDGYTSSSCLKDEFNYDNGVIDSLFAVNHFFVSSESRSNYNVTPFSLSSTFGMDYLRPGIENSIVSGKVFLQATETFKKNELVKFFKREGYLVRNLGCFDLENAPVETEVYFPLAYSRLIDEQTLYSRIRKDIWWHFQLKNVFTGAFRVPGSYKRQKKYHLYRNRYNWEGLIKEIGQKSNSPRFVVAHIMLPHEPFYVNEDGSEVSDTAILRNTLDTKVAYLNQVKYSNQLLKKLVRMAGEGTGRKKVLIIEGDHGFRFYDKKGLLNKEFMNLNAYYFSDQDYSMLYNGISPVNSSVLC